MCVYKKENGEGGEKKKRTLREKGETYVCCKTDAWPHCTEEDSWRRGKEEVKLRHFLVQDLTSLYNNNKEGGTRRPEKESTKTSSAFQFRC